MLFTSIRAIALSLAICPVLLAVTPATPPAPPGELVDLGGYHVHLYCTGTGTPAVIVMGGGFSVDWGLVQPEVAKFARICTYDPSGTAWSEAAPSTSGEQQSCQERVTEIHKLLGKAAIAPPYVLVGFSIGALVSRLYAHEYPQETAGLVFVDHAFTAVGSDAVGPDQVSRKPPERSAVPPPALPATTIGDAPPALLVSSPIILGIEDDANFRKLPRRDQDLHRWAMSLHPLRPTAAVADECTRMVEIEPRQPFPLGVRPLAIISTGDDRPAYRQLQERLSELSRNSWQIVAGNSTHMVIIDQPQAVVRAIRQVVASVRE